MSCDIHAFVESRRNDKSPWEYQGLWEYDEYDKKFVPHNCIPERDYELFYALAGVRGGYGNDHPPISEPRGLPKDIVYPLIDGSYAGTYIGYHSHSWLLFSEMLAYPWEAGKYLTWFPKRLEWLRSEYAYYRKPENTRLVFGFNS